MKNPNLKFIFGIVLILCGWIICFDLFLLMIGLAFFLLGTVLVLTAKKKLWVKILVIGLPILLWFIGFEIILHEISKPGSITILIPENYKGEFRIVEGEKNGIVPTEENERTTLHIPENGILITQAHLNLHQNTDFEFYSIDADGKRQKLMDVEFKGLLSPPALPGQSNDVSRDPDYVYDSFVIGKSADNSISIVKMDSLVRVERGGK